MSALGGQLLIRACDDAPVALSVREVGKAVGRRLCAYPDGAYASREFLATSIERRTGVRLTRRTITYALAALKREGYIAVRCCAGERCVGGRHHAARLVLGPRRFGGGFRLRGRFLVRQKGAIFCSPWSRVFNPLPSRKKERGPEAAQPVDNSPRAAPLRELLPAAEAALSGRASGLRPAAPTTPARQTDPENGYAAQPEGARP